MNSVRALLKSGIVVIVALTVVSCGDDSFRSTPVLPYTPGAGYQAPPPPNGFQPPITQPGPGSPIFNPQQPMPPQQPPQFYPFMPAYQFMQVNPGLQQMWVQLWQQWQVFAMQRQLYVYDFPTFWTQFCPQQQQFQSAYAFLDQSFYYWVQPGMQLPQTADCGTFWGDYQWYPMQCDYCF